MILQTSRGLHCSSVNSLLPLKQPQKRFCGTGTGRYVTSKCFCCERKHEAVFHAETSGGHHEEHISSEAVRILASPSCRLFTPTMQSSVLKWMRGCRRITKNSWFARLDLFSCSHSAALFVYAVAPEQQEVMAGGGLVTPELPRLWFRA